MTAPIAYERIATLDHEDNRITRNVVVIVETHRFLTANVVDEAGTETGTQWVIDKQCILRRTPMVMDLKYGKLVAK